MKKKLPNTLAERVQYLREKSNLSVEKLAERSNLEPLVIHEIEEGRETFLSTSVRQRISKELKVSAKVLKEVEFQPEQKEVPEATIKTIQNSIIAGNLENNYCPKCHNKLHCKIVTMYDLEDNPVKHPKARCTKCPFQIK
jgi:transcriptional regulator with XRE-family HTH domain